jgi:small conductance mechanosensitive channel
MAKNRVAALRNPFTALNMIQWLIDHGPRMGVIMLVMVGALWLTRVADRRIIDTMLNRGGLGRRVERENRARTLVGVFHNAANVAVVSGGVLMILDTIGAPIAALMGGAAVVGLAVAFGAQSLIKDFFYGFMILLEQQYTINDVIRIGETAGQVERITLRMTVLRDLEGCVHFVPHGTITSTTNMTHGWSRAMFEIGVAYKEDADAVIDLIKRLGSQMREDAYFGTLILEDLTMLGVDAFSESAVVIKFFIKTRPLKQWEVKRELLRRIKRAFDAQGIEIPFPHRTVYHRTLDPEEAGYTAAAVTPSRKSA